MGFNTKSSTASTSGSVTVGSSSTAVLAANPDRKSATIVNGSDEVVYLQLGATAVSGEGIYLVAAGGAFNIDHGNLFTGAINAICASGGKVVSVTETP